MAWKVIEAPHLKADPPTKSDWFATLRRDDGLYVMVQIDYHATEKQANEIVKGFTNG